MTTMPKAKPMPRTEPDVDDALPIDVRRLRAIREIVLGYYQVYESAFLGRGRHRRSVRARQAFVVLARRNTPSSYPEIAQQMKPEGARFNHSTPITQMRRADRRLTEDPHFIEEIDDLQAIVNAHKPAWGMPRMPVLPAQDGPYRIEGEFNPIPLEGGGS